MAAGAGEPATITVCQIDGNSLIATVVTGTPSHVKVLASRVVELDTLAEVTERFRHPIFMDVYAVGFPGAEAIREGFRQLFADQRFRHPVVGVYPSEKLTMLKAVGPATAEGRLERRRSLLQKIQAANPYYYPSMFNLTECPARDGLEATHLFVLRLEDMISVGMQMESLGRPFLGLILAQRGAKEILARAPETMQESPLALLDIGKLRTLYSLRLPDGRTYHNPIPVGLARDDMHYFTSIKPLVSELMKVQERRGPLLFPPDATPTPLFMVRGSTPQIDCTRMAIQVARFASRALDAHPKEHGHDAPSGATHYMLGPTSRMPGLRSYLEAWTDRELRNFTEMPLRGIELGEDVSWDDLSDTPVALGVGIAWLSRNESSFGLLLRENSTRRLLPGILRTAELEPGPLYIFDRPFDDIV